MTKSSSVSRFLHALFRGKKRADFRNFIGRRYAPPVSSGASQKRGTAILPQAKPVMQRSHIEIQDIFSFGKADDSMTSGFLHRARPPYDRCRSVLSRQDRHPASQRGQDPTDGESVVFKRALPDGSRAGPGDRLALVRRPGHREPPRYRRDVASREDAGRIPVGNGPRALAAIGNAMLRPVHIPAGPPCRHPRSLRRIPPRCRRRRETRRP